MTARLREKLDDEPGDARAMPSIKAVATALAASARKPYPEAAGLVLLALALLFNAILLAPEIRIERVPVNDLSFHLEASQRLGQSIAHGEPFLEPWVSQWSLGYPVWRSYQPLPHLLAAAVIALCRPFACFAVLYYLLLVLLPASIYLGARLLGLNPIAAGLASILILAPNEGGDFGRYGLSYGAFLWRGSGLYTELVSLLLLLPALGLATRAIDSGGRQTGAAVMIALTALSHIIFGYVAFLSIAIWALAMPGEGRARRLARAASIVARTMLLLAWFVVPMMLADGDINRSRWEAAYKFDSYGAPMILGELFSGRLLDFGRLPLLSLMVALGALIAAFNTKDSLARRLLVLTALWLALFFGRETWGHLLVLVGASADLPVHRLQAAFELFAILLAGWGLERILTAAIRTPGLLAVAVGAVVCGALVVIGVERGQYLGFNTTWGEQNLAAFQHARSDLELSIADLRAILAQRPGRVSAGKAAEWGSTFIVGSSKGYSLLTRYGLDQASFLYHSMSLTSDYMVLRNENDPVDQQLFGIRAVLAPAGLKAPPYFKRRAVHGPFAVYETSPEGYFGLVDVAARYVGPAATWFDPISAWMHGGLPRVGEVIALDPRLEGVPAIVRWQALPDPAPQFKLPRGRILAESKDGETYRATIDVLRPCYALCKITWFPGLVARVDGHRTPMVRVTPDFGAIPLTPGHHEVEIRYQPGPLKPLLFLAGIVLFALAARPSLGPAGERSERWLQRRFERCGEWLATDRARIAIALALLILLFTRALFRGKLIDGHDVLEYPPRLPEFAKMLGDQFPPMWAADLSSGHGQPLFEFAPPLVYAVALPFFKCGMDLADSLQFGLVLLFAMGALAIYLLGRKMSFSPVASLGGAAAWLFAPYQALDLYVRAAFAEAAAVAIAPVALLGLMTALERPTLLNAALGALAIALVPLAHNAIALLLFPVLAAIVLARSLRSGHPLRTAAAGAAAIAGGLGLSAFFWLPALLEKDFVKTGLLRADFLNWRVHIISPWQLFWGHWGFGYSVAGPNDGMSFSIGLLHVALAIAGAVIGIRTGIRALSRTRRLDAMVFAGAALAGAFLAIQWSAPIWAHVPTLQYMAYPWRTLFLPALFIPLLALFAFERIGPKATAVVIVLLVLVNLYHTQPKGYLTYDDEFYYPDSVAQKGLNTTTREEYEPRWVQTRLGYIGNGILTPTPLTAVRVLSWNSTRHVYSVQAPAAARVGESTNYYPGWTVLVDGLETAVTPAPAYGTISFAVPTGPHTITVELRPTTVRRRASVLSLLTLAALLLAVVAVYVDRALSLGMPRPAPSIEPESTDEPESTEPSRLSAAAARFLRRAEEFVARLAPASRARLTLAAGILLLMVFVGQGLMFIRANSQTFDEAIHLVSGYSFLATGQFRLYPQDPPLIRELSALPVYLWYRLPFKPDPEVWNGPDPYFYGETLFGVQIPGDFLYRSSVPADRLLTLARMPNLLLGTILVALVGVWSCRLWGAGAAIIGIWLAALDPNLVANSSLVTSDLGPTLFSFLTMYLLWEYTACASGWLLVATGISLGLALVSKFSTLLLFAVIAVAVAGGSLPLPGSKRTDEAKGFAVKLLEGTAAAVLISAVATMVIPLVYFGFHQGFSTWIAGLQEVLRVDKLGWTGFFLGKYSDQGWWSYFAVAFLIKTPTGTLLLIFAAFALYRAGVPLTRKQAIFLLVPVVAYLAAVSCGKIDIGLRHVLPMYPFLLVLASRFATVSFRRAWLTPAICAGALLLTTASSLRVAPHQLAYFNELVGGPGNGYRYLSDSNIDWGQDLKGLKAYMEREGLSRIYLSYFGSAPPSYYGITYQYVPSSWTIECCTNDGPPPGSREILAVSVVNLQQALSARRYNFFGWLYDRKPIAKIGYSIYVYDITGDAQAHLKLADAYLRAGGLLPLAMSEVKKAVALDPSNPDVQRMAILLQLPAAARPPPETGKISLGVPRSQYTLEPRPGGIPRSVFIISLLKFAALLLAVGFITQYACVGGKPVGPIDSVTRTGSVGNRVAYSLQRAVKTLGRLAPATRARLIVAAGILLAMVFVGQGVMFMRANSQTFDEAVHVVSGYSYLATRQFRLYPQDPPLAFELSALPAWLWYRVPFKPDPKIWNGTDSYITGRQTFDGWMLGKEFLYGASVSADRLLAISRIPNLVLGVLLVALIGRWSYRLCGPEAAIVGMWLAALDPNLVANSSVITADLAPTLFSLLTMYLLWEYTACASVWLLVATGISLGLALVSKFTAVLLLGLLGLAVVGDSIRLPGVEPAAGGKGRAQKLLRGSLAALMIVAIAAMVFPLVYFGFPGVTAWFAGFREVLTQQGGGYRAFLMGQYSSQGWWSYFVVALLLKTPVGTLLLIFASLIFYRAGAPLGRREAIFLLAPAVVFLAGPSSGKIDIGFRHVLPMYPFLLVLTSRFATISMRRAWLTPAICAGALLLTTVSSLSVAPHQLAYFNELVGGPGNGYRYLSDSNIDWGQDLKGLKTYMKHKRLRWVYLSYFGTAPPTYYGIDYQYAPTAFTLECCPSFPEPPGARDILAVSVVNFQDVMGGGRSHFYDWLRERTPIAKIGYSIYLYDITGDAEAHFKLADAYLRAGGLSPMAISEVRKALALDPSNPDAQRMASALHLSAAKNPSAPPPP